MARHLRSNLFIAAWICIIVSSGMIMGGGDAVSIIVGAPLAIGGACLFLLALTTSNPEAKVNEEDIRDWTPDESVLPESKGGQVMYRVDTTLDEPIRTSVLCGSCGELTWLDGRSPSRFTCAECDTELWDHPDEEE